MQDGGGLENWRTMGLFFTAHKNFTDLWGGEEHLRIGSDRELQPKCLDSDSRKHYFYNWSVWMKTHYWTMDEDSLCDKDDNLRSGRAHVKNL